MGLKKYGDLLNQAGLIVLDYTYFTSSARALRVQARAGMSSGIIVHCVLRATKRLL